LEGCTGQGETKSKLIAQGGENITRKTQPSIEEKTFKATNGANKKKKTRPTRSQKKNRKSTRVRTFGRGEQNSC